MDWLPIVFRFLPYLVGLAEVFFVGEKRGAEKKDFVLKALPEVARGVEEISTGGQKETWKIINANIGVIGSMVDLTAQILFPPDEEEHGN